MLHVRSCEAYGDLLLAALFGQNGHDAVQIRAQITRMQGLTSFHYLLVPFGTDHSGDKWFETCPCLAGLTHVVIVQC